MSTLTRNRLPRASSVLMNSAAARLAVALALVGMLWGAVAWALAGRS